MPDLTEQSHLIKIELLKSIDNHFVSITKEIEEKAKQECDAYFKNNCQLQANQHPYSFYYIISKLSETEQIAFFTQNIDYIKEHDEIIFQYSSLSPKSLAYFLSL